MPLFTPSRIIVVVVTFSLISFLWTFGLPHPLAKPSLPIIEHPADEAKLHDPIAPAPVLHTSHAQLINSVGTPTPALTPTPTPHGDRPNEEDDHRWDDKTGQPAHAEEPTPLPGPEETGPALPTTLLKETSPAPNAPGATAAPTLGSCKDVKNAQHVMVIVKTSKAEIDKKLSAHLLGLLSCVPNFAIFSDHAGEIDGVQVHDALHDISSDAKQTHGEFREYNIIKADQEYKPDEKKTKDLDKWKILPMVYKAYQMNPHARFYAFIEADTGLSWTNLLQWVDRLDYRIPYYSGAQTFVNHVQFAQRGPGILLSQGALRRYAKSYEERWATEWEKRVGKECCGDMVLATALTDAHVELYTSWPLIQGEQPDTLDYTPKQWCVPAVTWHHMDKAALDKSWDLQNKWTEKHGWGKPYLYRDAFHEYVQPHLKAHTENWDNLGSDTKIIAPEGRQREIAKEKLEKAQPPSDQRDVRRAGKREEEVKETIDWTVIGTMVKDGADNPELCKKVCAEVEDCLQWRYTTHGDGECHLSKVVRLGKAVEKKEGAWEWTSGWMVDRIKEETNKWECKEVNWKFYQ